MLSKPDAGWTDFQLEGTAVYRLSDLNDIAFDWLEEAIHGLETLMPFCVRGFMEPNRFLCTVSYWNCHIIVEDDRRTPLGKDDVFYEFFHTNMLEFCKLLYQDISSNLDGWASFLSYEHEDEAVIVAKRELLTTKLAKLNALIVESEEHFGEHRCFF